MFSKSGNFKASPQVARILVEANASTDSRRAFAFFNEAKPAPTPQRQTMNSSGGFYITNQTIINVASSASVQLTPLPPAAHGDPRSPRVSMSEHVEAKAHPAKNKKWCGLC